MNIDLRACFTSGQVFRFREVNGAWQGVDGTNIHTFNQPLTEPYAPSVQRFLRLDWNYQAVLKELTDRGPELGELLPNIQGLRLLRPSCPVETLFSFLCTSNNHISRITMMVEKLASLGEPLDHSFTRWPSVEVIGALSEVTLREMGFGYRAKTIPLVAREILQRGNEDWFTQLATTPYPDLIVELRTLPGVGPKLADCIALYAFDQGLAVPIDTHLWRAFTRVYRPDWMSTSLTDSKREYVGAYMRGRFAEFSGLAQQVLFYTNLRGIWTK